MAKPPRTPFACDGEHSSLVCTLADIPASDEIPDFLFTPLPIVEQVKLLVWGSIYFRDQQTDSVGVKK